MAKAEGHVRLPAPMRRSAIVRIVERDGFVSVAAISDALGVSEMTVRRDLDVLSDAAAVARTFGGAMRRERYDADEPALERRIEANAAAKVAIARRAAAMVGAGETLGLDVGSTALALARELAARADLRIVTSSLRAVAALGGGRSPVYVPGGRVRADEQSVVGASAVDYLRGFAFDRAFLGVSGICESGIYDYSVEDSDVKRALMAQAGCVVLLCDASKFGRRALSRVAGLEGIDILVTDAAPPPPLADALAAAEVEVIVATAHE